LRNYRNLQAKLAVPANPGDNTRLSDEERLQKVLARAGVASRRKAESIILDGRVTVNGKIVTTLGEKVKPRKDLIIVDGKRIQIPDTKNTFWVALNKPKGILTTVEDGEKGRVTVSDLVPRAKELRLVPVGGIDRDSTGLVILTNDLGWIHPLTHPSYHHRKKHEVISSGLPTEESLDLIRKGIHLPQDSLPCLPCLIDIIDYDRVSDMSKLLITTTESRPQQLTRMMEAISCPIISIKLLQFGPITLKGVRKGAWRQLSLSEVTKLKESCQQSVSKINTSTFSIKSKFTETREEGTGYRRTDRVDRIGRERRGGRKARGLERKSSNIRGREEKSSELLN